MKTNEFGIITILRVIVITRLI